MDKLILISCICAFYAVLCGAQLDSNSSLEVNTPCKTPNEKSGKCISIYECSVLYDQLTSAKQSVIDFLRDSDCGTHESVPLVCCGQDDDFDSAHQSTDLPIRERQPEAPVIDLSTRLGEDGPSGIASRSECGYMAEQDRIFGGLVTAMDEFPWMALLMYRSKSNGRRRFGCGGTLIGNRYVLTAAHCVTGIITLNSQLVGVRLGEFNTKEDRDCFRFQTYIECADPPVNVGIERVIAHPYYNEDRKEKPNDIALIRVDRDVAYSAFIRPICLPTTSDNAAVGSFLTVAGWGRTESGVPSEFKLKLSVPLTSRRNCRKTYREAGANIQETQICAGGLKGRDSCTGDSGGPLMTVSPSNYEQWYIEGVVSFGPQSCGTKGWPGVYTKVSAYMDWINQNVV